MNEEVQPDPIIIKPSRGTRLKKSIAARMRRKETKAQREIHSYKEQKEAKDRLISKLEMEKQQKMKVRKQYAMAAKKQTA